MKDIKLKQPQDGFIPIKQENYSKEEPDPGEVASEGGTPSSWGGNLRGHGCFTR